MFNEKKISLSLEKVLETRFVFSLKSVKIDGNTLVFLFYNRIKRRRRKKDSRRIKKKKKTKNLFFLLSKEFHWMKRENEEYLFLSLTERIGTQRLHTFEVCDLLVCLLLIVRCRCCSWCCCCCC